MSVQPGKRTVRKPTALEEYEGDLGPYDDGHDGKVLCWGLQRSGLAIITLGACH